MLHENAILAMACIGLTGIACQWIAWRMKLPTILILLTAGIIAGPVTGWLEPDRVFGRLLFPVISLSVAVVLFEGSLTLKFTEIQGLQTVVRRLVTTGVMLTWLIIALATHWLLTFSWKLSFLFGAITVVTGPTVVVPLLRSVRPKPHVSNILRWEGIVIDPIGALLGVLVFEFIISETGSSALSQTLLIFCRAVLLSSVIGGLSGFLFGLLIRNHWLPEYLHNSTALALVFGVYAAANAIQQESGLLAITVMGVCLTNMKGVATDDILNFKESLSIMLISGVFIILAARINFVRLLDLGWHAAGIFLVIQFVERPVKTLLTTWGTSLTWEEKLLIAWIAPRGIVAAATAAVFAVRLQEHGFDAAKVTDGRMHWVLTPDEYLQADLLIVLTFMVIIGTVVLQSLTARFLALRLGVAEPEAKGFLIVGANTFAREIAIAFRECGFRVLLADTNFDHIRAARMKGLDTYYGNAVSEHADRHLDLLGIGCLVALSEYQEMNQLACQRYRSEFGRRAVYSIQTEKHTTVGSRSRFVLSPEGRLLFGAHANISTLLDMIREGAEIHKTLLTEQHTFLHYLQHHRNNAVPLFAVNPNGAIKFFTLDNHLSPKPDWMVVSLVQPESSSVVIPPITTSSDSPRGFN